MRTLIGVTEATPSAYLQLLAERGVEAVPCGDEKPDLPLFLEGLKAKGVDSVVCEGGGTLSRALLNESLIERIYLMLLPVVLDAGSVNLFEGWGPPTALRFEESERLGDYLVLRYLVSKTGLYPGAP